jgi:hypothetical protein
MATDCIRQCTAVSHSKLRTHDVWVVQAQGQASLLPAVLCKHTANGQQLHCNTVASILPWCDRQRQGAAAGKASSSMGSSSRSRWALLLLLVCYEAHPLVTGSAQGRDRGAAIKDSCSSSRACELHRCCLHVRPHRCLDIHALPHTYIYNPQPLPSPHTLELTSSTFYPPFCTTARLLTRPHSSTATPPAPACLPRSALSHIYMHAYTECAQPTHLHHCTQCYSTSAHTISGLSQITHLPAPQLGCRAPAPYPAAA